MPKKSVRKRRAASARGTVETEIKKALKEGRFVIGSRCVLKELKKGRLSKVVVSSNLPEQGRADLNHYTSVSGIEITDYSVENIGPSLGSLFWSQAQTGIIIAFILMGIVAFVVFRTFVPSIAIVISAACDIIVTLAMMQVFGIEFSLASLGALLMLIGYSVDTDIMLTSRLLRETEEGMDMNEKMVRAVKTGLTMTLTSIGAVAALLIIPLPTVLVQIASVIFIGLSVDIVNTWLLNSVLLRWYCESRGVE